MKDGSEYNEMEEDEETNGEGENTQEKKYDDNAKDIDTEDDSKTTITTQKWRKEEGSGNEVKAPRGQGGPKKKDKKKKKTAGGRRRRKCLVRNRHERRVKFE